MEELTEIGNRMAGQEGEARGAEVMKDGFVRAGARDPQINEFEIPGWWRESAALEVTGPTANVFDRSYEIVALPGSPAASVSGELVSVGDGVPEDFDSTDIEGNVVLVSAQTPRTYGRWVNRIEKYTRAESGAQPDSSSIIGESMAVCRRRAQSDSAVTPRDRFRPSASVTRSGSG
ncbi:hypothetical protein ACFQJD_17455 [Haloplanus sp. GCM10025708]|uniref:hypothetical protein n=1 Tax=Haloplanus sp. GCM10025708 TaxID=3252679 RepID=UPI003621F082